MKANEATLDKVELASSCGEPSMQAWLAIIRVYEKIHKHASEHLHCYDLSPAQYDVLAQLHDAPGISQQELAGRLMVTKGNICTLINRMEDKGLVVRQDDPNDRRLHPLYLTGEGARIATEVIPEYARFVHEHMAALSSEDQAGLQALLGRLDEHLDTH
jgi:DNA-binding MarR family transcriptional regulator